MPADTPVTTPDELTVAFAVLLLLQVPPEMVLPRVVVRPAHTMTVPLMAPAVGSALMVMA